MLKNAKFIQVPGSTAFMADAPVTQEQYEQIMGKNPSYFKEGDTTQNPVEQVSWHDAQEFIKKLNESQAEYTYRLPTEAEWEACAKPCDTQNVQDIAWCYENSDGKTHPVRQKLPNDLGFYDMLGNVWEWCSDEYK